jgi:hypothetical protein
MVDEYRRIGIGQCQWPRSSIGKLLISSRTQRGIRISLVLRREEAHSNVA